MDTIDQLRQAWDEIYADASTARKAFQASIAGDPVGAVQHFRSLCMTAAEADAVADLLKEQGAWPTSRRKQMASMWRWVDNAQSKLEAAME